MTPAENEFIERQFEHLFRTDDCTLCDRAIRDNALTSFGLSCDGTAALVCECCQAKIKTHRCGAPRPGWDAWVQRSRGSGRMRRTLPQRRAAETFNLRFWNQSFTVTVGFYPDGTPGEVFIDGCKTGNDIESIARDAAVVLSLAIQHGVPP